MSERIRDLRNGVFCCLVFLGCWLLAWPVANMAYGDDWSYIETARVFAQTGHIVYNGWGAPMLGWMIPWGALFIKLFGFSFMAAHLSILPVALATLLLFHALLRRFAIGPRDAVIGALTLGLSPLFLPLSAGFLSDMPGLFAIVLCMYLCQRALAATTDRAAMGWLAAAAATNVIGGTARQVAWLGVLVMVPCTGWLLRRRPRLLVTALVLWVAGIGSVYYCMQWLARQPHIVKVSILPRTQSSFVWWVAFLIRTTSRMESLGLCLLLFTFPIFAIWLREFGRKISDYVVLVALGLFPLLAAKQMMGANGEIWPPNTLLSELSLRMLPTWDYQLSLHKTLAPVPVQILISMLLLAAFFGLVTFLRKKGWTAGWWRDDSPGSQMFWLLVPFSLSYFALLMTLVWHGMTYDKYVIGVMPPAIVIGLWLYERYMGGVLPRAATYLLIFYAAISVAGVHTWFASRRAMVAAIGELRKAGVPRTEIDGGLEYNGWTQVRNGGQAYNPYNRAVTRTFQPPADSPAYNPQCDAWSLLVDSDVRPIYEVGNREKQCYAPSKFPAVHYTAWLPPFDRVVEVQRVVGRQDPGPEK